MSLIRDRIKRARAELGESVRKIQEGTGVSRSNVSNYETGKTESIPADYIAELTRAYGFNPRWLLGLDEGPMFGGQVEIAEAAVGEIEAVLARMRDRQREAAAATRRGVEAVGGALGEGESDQTPEAEAK